MGTQLSSEMGIGESDSHFHDNQWLRASLYRSLMLTCELKYVLYRDSLQVRVLDKLEFKFPNINDLNTKIELKHVIRNTFLWIVLSLQHNDIVQSTPVQWKPQFKRQKDLISGNFCHSGATQQNVKDLLVGSRFLVALLRNLANFATKIYFGREKPEHANAPNVTFCLILLCFNLPFCGNMYSSSMNAYHTWVNFYWITYKNLKFPADGWGVTP